LKRDEQAQRKVKEKEKSDSSYWVQTKRPIYALWIVLGMLVIYETGLAWVVRLAESPLGQNELTAPAARNWSEVQIQKLLGWLGVYGTFLSAAVVVGTLLAWQLAGRHSWRAKGGYFWGIMLEGIVYATVLGAISFGVQRVLASGAGEMLADARFALVFSFGAGVYEEYVFRLLLVPVTVFVLRDGLDLSGKVSALGAALVSGLLFAASHHVGVMGWEFSVVDFTFRSIAGMLFAFFFLARGFAVTSLTHALYDVGVTVLMNGS